MCVRTGTPEGIRFSDACWFRFTKDFKEGYELATNYETLTTGGYKVRIARLRGPRKNIFDLRYMLMNSRLKYVYVNI